MAGFRGGCMIGFTASGFDLLHAGHIEMLRECKNNCDYLIVGLNLNPTKKVPTQSAMERYVQIAGCKYVDEVIPYESEKDLENLLLLKRIDIRFLGEDYVGLKFTGDHLDIDIHYNDRNHGFSTSELKDRCKKN
jgi:glycerol-3-phosphate cytidylyltransferase